MRHVLMAFRVPVIVIVLAVLLATVGDLADSTIGIYSDEYGSTCSFSGNTSGPLTTYVVVRPEGGLRGVRFAAPIPACLGATFVTEEAAPGLFSIGESATDISIAIPYCAEEPTFVLQMTYNRTSTDPCCSFPVIQNPYGTIEGTDCFYNEVTLIGATAKFNADASCPCIDANPPHPPHTPARTGVLRATGSTSLAMSTTIAFASP